jgi:class 3 adenylate cyclase
MLNAQAAAGWLPRLLVARPGAAGDASAVAARFAAAVLWLDVSGFTALSEMLGEQGPAGAERLSELLNERFGKLIAVVVRHGGDITHFAGDAICAVWPATAQARLAQGLHRAAQAALALQALPEDTGSRANEPPLRVRAGLAAGDCAWTLLGDDDESYFVVGGAPAAQAAAAAAAGEPGEVIVVASAWPLLPGAREAGERTLSGNYRLGALPEPDDRNAGAAHRAAAVDPDTVARYLPRVLRERLALSGGWLAEFRRVTVLFVGFGEGNFAEPALHASAQTQVRALQALVARYDGTVHQLVAEERGATLIAAWGLAGVAHEDDARRGVEAALAMHAELTRRAVPCAVGIATGRLFCGVRGSEVRREWAIVGDRMNLAARLARAAGSGLLCDDGTAQAASAKLRFETLPPIALKGKARPVPVFRPLGGSEAAVGPSSRPDRELVGRSAEGEQFDAWLADCAERRRGGAWLIEGEAGIGKSALLAELARRADARAVTVLRGEGDAVESATAYYAWRGVLRGLLGSVARSGIAEPDHALEMLLADEPAARARRC